MPYNKLFDEICLYYQICVRYWKKNLVLNDKRKWVCQPLNCWKKIGILCFERIDWFFSVKIALEQRMFTVQELKEALRERSLAVYGTRAELIWRLEDHDVNIWITLTQKREDDEAARVLAEEELERLYCDASSTGFGAIVLKKQEDGKFRPTLYFSQRTAVTESRYHSFELECPAAVYAIKRFHIYLSSILLKSLQTVKVLNLPWVNKILTREFRDRPCSCKIMTMKYIIVLEKTRQILWRKKTIVNLTARKKLSLILRRKQIIENITAKMLITIRLSLRRCEYALREPRE